MYSLLQISIVILKTAKRDKLLQSIAAVGVLLAFLIPIFSLFSMRQVQELAITIATSAFSFVLLVVALLLGASSIWRDLEKKYIVSLLGLPLSRTTYLLGKFFGCSLILAGIACVLGVVSVGAIYLAAAQYASELPLLWGTLAIVLLFDTLKYLLLLSIAFLFSAVSTSYYFPFFSTLAIYFAGMASQEVQEYVGGSYGDKLAPAFRILVKCMYYLIPNLSSFNLKVYAIYSLPLNIGGLSLTLLYFGVYTAIVLCIATWFFSRREIIS